MKIQILSDIHGAFKDISISKNADIILVAGDVSENIEKAIFFLKSLIKPVFYIAGNHEFYFGEYNEKIKEIKDLCSNSNITFLDNQSIEIDDIKIIASTLWSDFNNFDTIAIDNAITNMNDYNHILYNHNNIKSIVNSHIKKISDNFILNRRNILLGTDQIKKNIIIKNFLKRNKLINYDENRDYITLMNGNDLIKTEHNIFSPFISYIINQESINYLKNEINKPFSGKKILMTHHSISKIPLILNSFPINIENYNLKNKIGIKNDINKNGSYTNSLDDIISNSDLYCGIHGHFHDNMSYLIGNTPIFCKPTIYYKNHKTEFKLFGVDTNISFKKDLILSNQLNSYLNYLTKLENLLLQLEKTITLNNDINVLYLNFYKSIQKNINITIYYIKKINPYLSILDDIIKNHNPMEIIKIKEYEPLSKIQIQIITKTLIKLILNVKKNLQNKRF